MPAITDYAIRYSIDNGSTWTLYPHTASAATSRRLILTNGNTYIFQVAPVVSGGVGVYSPSSLAVTPYSPAAKPDAPSGLVAVTIDGVLSPLRNVSLSWNPVPGNAGGPVTDYVVQYRVNTPNARWQTYRDPISPATSANLRLRFGYSYVFRVAAKNLAGVGSYSAQSTPVPAPDPTATTPLAPSARSQLYGPESASISWDAPTSNGGSDITGYKVEVSAFSGVLIKQVVLPSTSRFYMATGLQNGVQYTLRVAAVNAAGVGEWSQSVIVTPHEPVVIIN